MNRSPTREDSTDECEERAQEQELLRLQKQFRMMEGDRRAYTEESRNLLKKQEKEIDALKAENREIRTVMRLAQSEKNDIKDELDTVHLQDLISKMDTYKSTIIEEKEKITFLDNEIGDLERTIRGKRKLGSKKMKDDVCQMTLDKRIRVMENRLDKATVHFNQQLASNRRLRQEIDHLRQERAVFDNLNRRLNRELDDLKHEKAKVIEEATHAYEERDEAQTKMVALQERGEKDLLQHESEMKELQRIINHDNKLKEFMLAKAQDRSSYKAEEDAKKSKDRGDKSWDLEQQIILSYEEAFQKIREITGENDITKIVNDFIKTEDENFALFNYVNELNDEVDKLQEEDNDIKCEIARFKEEDIRMEKERKAIMRQLELRSTRASSETDNAERRYTKIRKVLDQLKDGVGSLFRQISCDASTVTDALGSEEGVTDKNVMQYIGIVERRTVELLHVKQYLHMRKTCPVETKDDKSGAKAAQDKQQQQQQLQQQLKAPQGAMLAIIPPSTEYTDEDEGLSDEGLDDDFATRPFTREELTAFVTRNITRRASPRRGVSAGAKDKKQKAGARL